VTWVEALVLEAEGKLEMAEAALTEAQSGFAVKQMAYDAALVSLDLVRVLLRQGEMAKATMAGVYLVEAMRRREASLHLVGEILDFLKRARRDPSLRFDPARLLSGWRQARDPAGRVPQGKVSVRSSSP
jgi:hypothetical protein